MKQLCFIWLMGAAIVLVAPAAGMARTIHVSVTGSDENVGTAEQPLASVQSAVDRAQPGDVVRLGPGTFEGPIVVRRSGRAEAPITIEGSRGPGGERLSCLMVGDMVSPQTWQPAPEVGPNVYQNTSFAYEPKLLTVNGRSVADVDPNNWVARASDTPEAGQIRTILAWPEDQYVTTASQYAVRIPFWETMGGVYAYSRDEGGGVTYLRLARGADPRDHDVAISPGGAVVTIADAAYIVLRGVQIGSGEIGVQITGAQAKHNLIDDCFISHSRIRVWIKNKAAHNTVQNCHIAMAFIGARPGAWGDDSLEAGQREYVYNFFKKISSPNASSDDRAIRVENGARDTTITHNHLDGGLVAITSSSIEGLDVGYNTIHDFSSVGLSIVTGTMDARFHDNLIYNCNKNIRLHRLNQGAGHRVYIYRNRLFQAGDLGEHIYTHAHTEAQLEKMGIKDYDDPEVTLYHNTFVGGGNFWSQTTRLRRGVPKFHMINNVIAAQQTFRWLKKDSVVGVFDYNWIQSDGDYQDWQWFGAHNIVSRGGRSWSGKALPTFRLPPGSTARQAGIDLSQPFTIDGKVHAPLPGMEPGYYGGDRPDMGAIQHVH